MATVTITKEEVRKKVWAARLASVKEFWRRLLKSGSSKLGFAMLAAIVLLCLVGPFLTPYDFSAISVELIKAPPSLAHPLGCDAMGRDMLARIMLGGRSSLLLGFAGALFASILGIILGVSAGYFGGAAEEIIMRFMDIWSALPGMMLCILVSAAMGSGLFPTILALAIGGIPGAVRMERGQVLSERTKEYIEAAESINCSRLTIMFKHLLPNTIQPMIVNMTMSIGATIGMAASLSYIGLGVQPPTPEWGAMLSEGKSYIETAPMMLLVPGMAIALTIFSINLLGDGLRDALDPKMRN